MARKTVTIKPEKEQSLLDGSSPDSGSGADSHMPIRASGQSFRALLRFAISWAPMEKLVSAELRLRTTGGVHIGGSSFAGGSLRIGRLSGSFSSGGGDENYWSSSAATIWPGPGIAESVDRSWPIAENTWTSRDVLELVEDWAPSSVLKADGTPGEGRSNYGIRLEAVSGLVIEFHGKRSSYDPELVITYEDSVAPTVEWSSPSSDSSALVSVLGVGAADPLLTARLGARIEPGGGDTLTAATWRLLSGTTAIASGSCSPFAASGFDWIQDLAVALTPGAVYVAEITATAAAGGAKVFSRSFRFPVGRALHAFSLGADPTNVGATVHILPAANPPAPGDGVAVAYARSTNGTTPDSEGWSETVPGFPAGSWWLLVRSTVWRRSPGHVPSSPEGVDSIAVTWR